MQVRKNWIRLVGMLAAGLVPVAGCATPVQEAPQEILLTADEALRLEGLKDAAERVRVAYGAGCLAKPCAPGFLIKDQMEGVAMWDGLAFRISLQRRALAPGVEPRPAVAHELSHWLLGHTHDYCAMRAFECETAANAEAVRVLVAGWALSQEEAISLMYDSLNAGLNRARPLRGHDTPCREVAVFAQAFNRLPPACPDGPR